jgi:general secretion pathway protein K
LRIACTEPESDNASERGVALVIVLWVLALVSVLVLTYGLSVRSDLLLVRNQNERLQAEATADAGITLAILAIFDPSSGGQWRADGTFHVLSYRHGSIRVSVQDEHGKIDLNAAPDTFLRSLFQTLDVTAAVSETLIGDIEKFRNPGLVDGVSSAQNGFSAAPPGNPFLTVDELRLLPSVTAVVYDAIAPFVTVYSGTPQVDPYTAPPEVLRSIPGIRPEEAEAFLATRGSTSAPLPFAPPYLTGVAPFILRGSLEVFTVHSEGITPAGTRFVREATAELTGHPEAPYRFLAWRELHPRIEATTANPD